MTIIAAIRGRADFVGSTMITTATTGGGGIAGITRIGTMTIVVQATGTMTIAMVAATARLHAIESLLSPGTKGQGSFLVAALANTASRCADE